MGGIRTAGDLVLRVQLAKGMKLNDAKDYVAKKLGITREQMCDSSFMFEYRKEHGIGIQMPYADAIMGMECKIRIADLLGITINSVEKFKKNTALG